VCTLRASRPPILHAVGSLCPQKATALPSQHPPSSRQQARALFRHLCALHFLKQAAAAPPLRLSLRTLKVTSWRVEHLPSRVCQQPPLTHLSTAHLPASVRCVLRCVVENVQLIICSLVLFGGTAPLSRTSFTGPCSGQRRHSYRYCNLGAPKGSHTPVEHQTTAAVHDGGRGVSGRGCG
jgi:hypothetical protein